MAKEVVCTIVTRSHLNYARALAEGAKRFRNVDFVALVIDVDQPPTEQDLTVLRPCDLNAEPVRGSADQIRWTSKSILLQHLLEQYERAIFFDPDIYICNDYGFLFEQLKDTGILLTPHWRPIHTPTDTQYPYTFTDGMFQAGFVGASRTGLPALQWWEDACRRACVKNNRRGLWVDQKYLDVFPAYFSELTTVVTHRGCNVAHWNDVENRRVKVGDEVLINGEYPIIFVHVSGMRDPDLGHIYEAYDQALAQA